MRLARPLAHQREMIGFHSEVFQIEVGALLGQQSQHDRLAMDIRCGRDAHIELAPAHPRAHAPVLRQAALGDIGARDELDARSHRGKTIHGLGHALVQHTIDPDAHHEQRLAGLDVDIGCLGFHGLREDVVDQFDDRRFLGQFAQCLVGAGGEFIHRPLAAKVIEAAIDIVAACEMHCERCSGGARGERLQHQRGKRVLRGPADRAIGHLPHQHALVEEPVERYARLERALQHLALVGYRRVHAEHRGIELQRQHAQQRLLGQRAGSKQDRAEPPAGGGL